MPRCPRRRHAERRRHDESVVERPGLRHRPGPFLFLPENTFMKITVNTRKPRNPLVAHAHFRRAGSHQNGGRSMRQEAGRSLKRELDQMKQNSP
jgi:hypothetical protein